MGSRNLNENCVELFFITHFFVVVVQMENWLDIELNWMQQDKTELVLFHNANGLVEV